MKNMPLVSRLLRLLLVLLFSSIYIQAQVRIAVESEKILNGKLDFPDSQKVEISYTREGFAMDRLSKVPKAGVHPRILFSASEIPAIVERLEATEVGKVSKGIMYERLKKGFLNTSSWTYKTVQALIDRDFENYEKLQLKENKNPAGREGYNRFSPLYDCELAALDALLFGKPEQGARAAAAIAGYAIYLKPSIQEWRKSEFPNNASRWGSWHHPGSLELFSWQQLGYAYDFAHNFMTEQHKTDVRTTIAAITNGSYVFGMNLPPHLRSWNWINVGHCFGLLALAIEGEAGYEKRIYDRSVEMMRDYLSYNYSKKGSSTEAAGYTSFGWLWGAPALAAMARRGDNLMLMDRYKAIKHWHFRISLPDGSGYLSHGDGGERGPGITEMSVMKFFYPEDKLVDYNYSLVSKKYIDQGITDDREFSIPVLLWGLDPTAAENPFFERKSHDLTWYDEERGNLITRNEWSKDAFVFNIECRTDSYYSGHEHADRGNFNIMANGRLWAPEGFRSVESRYHNVVTIDGRGQGYFPPPGKVLGVYDSKDASFLVCDTKYAYDWFWPKSIVGVDLNGPKFDSGRFAHFKPDAEKFQAKYSFEKETHPNVVNRFKGFDIGDSGMWDEDPWTIRSSFNPVKKAFRTAGMIKGKHPYVLILDDIQKDEKEHYYEWNMMLNMDIVPINIEVHDAAISIGPRSEPVPKNIYTDIILGSDKIERRNNRYYPKKGEPLLLIRVLEVRATKDSLGYDGNPMPRVEVFEKKDVRSEPGGRSFGLDKKLVVPSRSITPKFKILIYPYLHEVDPIPKTTFSNTSSLEVKFEDQIDRYDFLESENGRTLMNLKRGDKTLVEIK